MSEDDQEQVVPADQKVPAAKEQTAPAPVEEQVADEATADETGADDAEGEKPKKSKIQKDFDRLTRQRGRLERENRELAERLSRLESKVETPEAPKQTDGKPRLEDFGSYDAFNEALTDWKVDQKLNAKAQEQTQAQRQREAQTKDSERKERFLESSDAAREKYDDYDDVVFSDDVKITRPMAVIIAETENPGEVAYWLGKNPSEAQRIAKLSPERAAIELGKVEMKLSLPAPKTQTGAPPPAKTLSGGRTTRAGNPNSPDAIYAKYSK